MRVDVIPATLPATTDFRAIALFDPVEETFGIRCVNLGEMGTEAAGAAELGESMRCVV